MPTHNNMSTSGSFVSTIQQKKVNILDLRQYDPVCLFGRTIKTSSHITPLKVFLKGSYGISSVFVEIFEGSLRWPMLRTSNHTNLCYFLKGFPSFEVGHMTLPRKIHDVGPMGRYKWPGDFGAQTQTKMVTDAAYCKVTDVFYPDSSHPGFLTHILPKFPDSIWGFQDVLFQKKLCHRKSRIIKMMIFL